MTRPKREPRATPSLTRIRLSPLVDLARLESLPLTEVRVLWLAYGGEGTSPQRRIMIREIAFLAQARIHGDLDPSTRTLLDRATRDAFKGCQPRTLPEADDSQKTKRQPMPRIAPSLPAGSRLVRRWKGRTYEVKIVQDGKAFVYEGTTYRSLSRIALLITGSTRSGPEFFGLRNRATRGPDAAPRRQTRRSA